MSTLPKIIEVKAGDTLSSLAYEILGDYSSWKELAYFNNLNIFDELKVGSSIKIPIKEEVQKVLDSASSEITELNGEVQSVVKEILDTRAGKSITKLLGVDNTQLLKDLDLSSLAKGVNNLSKQVMDAPEWSYVSWVL
ncbi:LysM peptidoglycan-binding domain-containing protein [Nostoc sp. FACHB-152]|uniref:LysM peptidoglycan-binding domain-containing protein n=1 Tax=Nostoc sp. FACHB-152 TaxID=2692837 RepID=UPI00168498EB|nr:LysM domain-containing protein [Nostoc sp. FACHB-152]MBD2452245.1 LysM peptidoglycan-binding domain-containing protein [Nostoc sp. FACHB-152]